MKTHSAWRWVWPALLLLLVLGTACSPKIVRETVVVEKEKLVEKVVRETVVVQKAIEKQVEVAK